MKSVDVVDNRVGWSRGRAWRRLGAWVALAVALAAGTPRAARAQDPPPPMRCEQVSFPVSVAPGHAADYAVAGWMCTRGSVQHETIQVLVHGAGYSHAYWDWPLRPDDYSYASHATAAGYTTVAIDRLGYGASSRPEGADLHVLTLHNGAWVVHQVVQALRSGTLLVPGLGLISAHGEHVMLVGHSLGSVVAAIEASTYGDVAGVVLTGFTHFPGPMGFASFGVTTPACNDPLFAALPCDVDPATGQALGYITDVPFMPFPTLFPAGTPTRTALFFDPASVDADVLALDTDLRQTFTAAEFGDIVPSLDPATGATANLRVPTLLANGESDFLLCDPPSCSATRPLAFEAPFFPPEAGLEMHNIAQAAHSINLHHGAGAFFAVAREWADRRVGASTP